MNKRIIQNGCRTPSWISLFPWQLQILASTHPLWTFLCSFLPNFIFALWYFMISGKYEKRLWLSDAILNILFLEVVREMCKNWVISDLNWEVFAKFHLCFMKNEDFRMKEIFKMAAGRHLEYLCLRNSYRSWQVYIHYRPPYVALCQISALQNHFQTEPLKYVHCWATIQLNCFPRRNPHNITVHMPCMAQ